jgi:hypothetical protein
MRCSAREKLVGESDDQFWQSLLDEPGAEIPQAISLTIRHPELILPRNPAMLKNLSINGIHSLVPDESNMSQSQS